MSRIHQQSSTLQHERWFGIRCKRLALRAIWLFAMLALLASSVIAQSTSLLNGSVSDPSGANVVGAQITLTDPATGLKRTTTSNGAGLYQLLDVPPGTYQMEVTASGFAPYVASNVTLVVKTPSTIKIHLQLEGVKTSVEVEAQAPLINRTDASLGNTLENDQISELPIAARNVVEFSPSVTALYLRSSDNNCTRAFFTGLFSFETTPAMPSSSTTHAVLLHCAAANDESKSRIISRMNSILMRSASGHPVSVLRIVGVISPFHSSTGFEAIRLIAQLSEAIPM